MTREAFFTAARAFAPDGRISADDFRMLDSVAKRWGLKDAATAPAPVEPEWIRVARSLLGTREIVGAKHSPIVVGFWKRIGAGWFSDDETPWCGAFVGHCIASAGLPVPTKGEGARALSWASWGVACPPQLGAIGVKKRAGGNHVFFIVGETPDKRFFKALGGNQGNAVSIIDIPKAEVFAIRWPAGVAQSNIPLPVIAAGQSGVSEA